MGTKLIKIGDALQELLNIEHPEICADSNITANN